MVVVVVVVVEVVVEKEEEEEAVFRRSLYKTGLALSCSVVQVHVPQAPRNNRKKSEPREVGWFSAACVYSKQKRRRDSSSHRSGLCLQVRWLRDNRRPSLNSPPQPPLPYSPFPTPRSLYPFASQGGGQGGAAPANGSPPSPIHHSLGPGLKEGSQRASFSYSPFLRPRDLAACEMWSSFPLPPQAESCVKVEVAVPGHPSP